MKKEKGFTLIELIVVIIILGILAATALPKFVDMGSDARKSVVAGLAGSMSAANTMIYAKAALAGQTTASTATNIAVGSVAAVSTLYGYAATATALASTMDYDTTKFSIDTTSTPGGIYVTGKTLATCGVSYTPATATASPVILQIVGGC